VKFVPRIFTRWVFWAAVAGAFALYTAAGFLLVPRLVQSQIRSNIAKTYHRVAQVGEVRFNPFTFVLEIDNFALPDIDGRPMLQFVRLHIDFELISILRRALSYKSIALELPAARVVVRPDGTLNLVDLAPPDQRPKTVKPPDEDEDLPRLFIEAFTVNNGRIDFEDQSRPSRFKTALKPITFALRNFSTFGTGDNAYSLEAESVLGEHLSWRGRLNAKPVNSSGEFAFTNIHAATVWDYIRDAVAFEVPAGTFDLVGSYTFSLARTPVDLNIVGSELKLNGLVVRPRNSTVDDVHLEELTMRDARVSVADRRVTVADISSTGGKILSWLEPDGTFSLSRLAGADTATGAPAEPTPAPAQAAPTQAAPIKTAATKTTPAKSDRDWQIALPHVQISGLEVAFEDRGVKPVVPIKLAPIEVKLTGYDSAKAGPLTLEAHIGIDGEGKLSAQGSVDPDTLVSALDLEIKSIDLRTAQPYIARVTDMTLLSGKLGAKGKLGLTRDEADSLQATYAGTLEVTKLRTIDNALEQDFIRWDHLVATGIDYDGAHSHLIIKQIAAHRPYARVIIASNGTININEILRPASAPATGNDAAAAAKTAEPSKPAAPFDVRIGLVRIDKGSANFADFTLRPNFATGIQELSGTVTGLSSKPDSRAKVDLDGKVDAYAPVTIDGEVNYLSADSYTDLKLAFDNMELTTFTPYSGKFAGYRIEKGKLSVRLAYKIEDRKLAAQHKVILDQLQLGERVESKDATKLPVKLAIALLKDRNGVIDLDLPVTGTLDDPKFRLGPLIWKIVVNLVTKIVTAPFALIGKLFGGGDEVNQLQFAAGSSEPHGESAARIESVGKAMRERPALQIEVPITVSPTLDGPFLQKNELDQRLLALKRRELLAKRKSVDDLDASVLEDREEYWRLLHEYNKQAGVVPPEETKEKGRKADKPPEAELLETEIATLQDLARPTIEVPETALADLGKARAQKVQDLLLGAGDIEPGRLFIINSGPAPTEGELVRMNLSLR
jgi:uncharacterized protein involved in outer membrane biogenesis